MGIIIVIWNDFEKDILKLIENKGLLFLWNIVIVFMVWLKIREIVRFFRMVMGILKVRRFGDMCYFFFLMVN